MALEQPEVVVDELAREPDPAREHRRGRRLGERREQPHAHGIQDGFRGGRVLDDVDVEHAGRLAS